MKNSYKLLNDLSRIAGSAAGNLIHAKGEAEEMLHIRLEKILKNMDLVTKDEFDAMQAMLVKSRTEQEELKNRIETLENYANSLTRTKKSNK